MPPQEDWRRAKEIFLAALQRPPGERDAFIAGHCDDESLRAEVTRLLRMHDESDEFLATPIRPKEPSSEHEADPLIGRRFGDFVLLRRIGAGGMGVVYEAQQERPRRRAAVKALRPGFATPLTTRRLEYEAEVLARLRHPGIASVYAAGTFEMGDGTQPWFAMELVDGTPLSAFVESRRLGVRSRIELLLQICDAVQYAHQKGVIHRDLKPGNILVVAGALGPAEGAPQDAAAGSGADARPGAVMPKVLDFGVARVIGAEKQATLMTAAGDLVGTLGYMSPEQLLGESDEIDARSDVYALGVIGFELLTGRSPHDRPSSRTPSRPTGVAGFIRAIERERPARLGAFAPRRWGDLETVFDKVLERDPARRYQSAVEFADDVRRYLNNEPVRARPATAVYRVRKFVRRNRALCSGIAATMLALALGAAMYASEARQARLEAARAKYEADKATAINNFVTNDFVMKLLAAANAQQPGERLSVAGLVDRAAESVGIMFADDPLAEAAVRNEVATIYYNLGAFDAAAREFGLALELWERRLGPDHPDTLKAVNNLGQSLAHLKRNDAAEAFYRRALQGRLRALGPDDPYTLATMNNLASLLRGTGRLDEAEVLFRRTLDAQRRVHGETHKHTLITLANLGSLVLDRGNVAEALQMHRRAYEAAGESLGADHVTTLSAASRLAETMRRAGSLEEAVALQRGVVAAFERLLGPSHRQTIQARRELARIYQSLGRPDDAAEQLSLALEHLRGQSDYSVELERRLEQELSSLTAPAAPPP